MVGLYRLPLRQGVGALLLAVLLFTGSMGVVLAHAKLVSSNPADGSRLAVPPTQVTLAFSEDLSLDGSTIRVSGANGSTVDSGNAAVNKADRRQMSVGLGTLAPALYTVHWRAVAGEDNAVTEGDISFTVEDLGSTATPSTGNTTSVVEPPSPVPSMSGGAPTPAPPLSNASGTLPRSGNSPQQWPVPIALAVLLWLGWRLRRRNA